MSSIENELFLNKVFPDNPKDTQVRPVKRKYLDRVSQGETLLLKNTVGNVGLNSLTLYGRSTQNTVSGKNLCNTRNIAKNESTSIDESDWVTVVYDNSDEDTVAYVNNSLNYSDAIVEGNTYTVVCEVETLDVEGEGGEATRLSVASSFEDKYKGQVVSNKNLSTTGLYVVTAVARDSFEDCVTLMRNIVAVSPHTKLTVKYRLSLFEGDLTSSITEDTFVYEPFTGNISSPNPDYPQEISSVGDGGSINLGIYGRNLLNLDDIATIGATSEISEEGYVLKAISEIGASSSTVYYSLPHSKLRGKTVYFDIDSTTNENISKQRLVAVVFRTPNEKVYKNVGPSLVIDVPDDVNSLRMYQQPVLTTQGAEPIDPTLPSIVTTYGARVGLIKDEWQAPRKAQEFVIQTPNGVPAIEITTDYNENLVNYTDSNGRKRRCDEINFESGMYVQRIGKVELTSDMAWALEAYSYATRFTTSISDCLSATTRTEILSNRFKFAKNGHEIGTAFTYSGRICIYPPSTVTTAKELGAWLDEHPTTVYYMLENEVETPLDDETMENFYNLSTNQEFTTILDDEDVYKSVGYVMPMPKRSKNSALKMWFRDNPIF